MKCTGSSGRDWRWLTVSDPEVPTLADAARDAIQMMDVNAEGLRRLSRGGRFVLDGYADDLTGCAQRLRAALGQREPDTSAEDERAAWERMDRVIDGANPTLAVPATPEGGELDDLLADLNFLWKIPRDSDKAKAARDRLVSALRSQREQLTDERRRVEVFRTAANVSHASVVKLERELAEVNAVLDVVNGERPVRAAEDKETP
jgi:hypothetical protein